MAQKYLRSLLALGTFSPTPNPFCFSKEVLDGYISLDRSLVRDRPFYFVVGKDGMG